MEALERTSEWKRLLASEIPASLKREFASDPDRASKMTAKTGDLVVDFSKQLIDEKIIERLLDMAEARDVHGAFARMAGGERINFTENRAVGHLALRVPKGRSFSIDGKDVAVDVHAVLDRMSKFADAVRSGEHVGGSGRAIRTVVNIGIGGSDLGPSMVYEALRTSCTSELSCRFVANVDPADLAANLVGLDPAETLFVVASKTFTTVETLANARAARDWIVAELGESAVARHFVAVSTNAAEVEAFGIDAANMFGFWDWVGGRFSVPSAIGLSVMLAVGPLAFGNFLAGMHSMDCHAGETRGRANIPLMMALINVWNHSAVGVSSRAVVPYSFDLRRFPAYLQQLIMESNGKSVRSDGSQVPYSTSPVIWGEPGTNGQHAFMQLLHQGTEIVPVDFIGFARSSTTDRERSDLLFTNMLAQSQALAFGRSASDLPEDSTRPHRVFAGNRPSTTIVAAELNPHVLGQIIALYEHVVFFEGIIWDINSFDQWGVELGKQLANVLGDKIRDFSDQDHLDLDSSTHTLLSWFVDQRNKPDPR